ncbi:MAG: hypothetical protein PHR77_20055 [Kiritimatiellae bacterium]|nr:hypothetical protein [Kiritimatiellia bacterium]MDD5522773.1 hypothetical protein [Kiritimatiellia bacterium]
MRSWGVGLAMVITFAFTCIVHAADTGKSDGKKIAADTAKRIRDARNTSKLQPLDFAGMKFKRVESDHFVLLADGGPDPATFLANAEEAYAHLCLLVLDLDEVLAKPDAQVNSMNATVKITEKKSRSAQKKADPGSLRVATGKMLLIAVENERKYKQFGKWFHDTIIKSNETALAHYNAFYAGSGWYTFYLPNDEQKAMGTDYIHSVIIPMSLAKGEVSSLLIHKVATLAFWFYSDMREIPYLFWLSAGLGYVTELALTGESQTYYKDVYRYAETQGRGVDKDSIQISKTFDDKKAWAKTVKQLIGKRNAKIPDISKLMQMDVGTASAEMTGYLFGFMAFLTKDDESRKMLTAFLKETKANENLLPTLIKTYGYPSADEMKQHFVEYMKSKEFK